MYYNDNHNCTNILLIRMLFNILIMIGDRGSNNIQGRSKRRKNGKLLVYIPFFLFVHIKKITNKLIFDFNINRT